jgi:LPXTG-site transpeptidase (sortase) family protein
MSVSKEKTVAPKASRLRQFNHGLTGVVAILAIYILVAPFLPQMGWWLRHDAPVRIAINSKAPVTIPAPTTAPAATDQPNELLIPQLDMRETVHGGDIRSLKKGVWHLPHTSTPDKGGNTVLVGHRFTYDGQSVFYHLDKVRKKDRLGLWWDGKLYEYEVVNTMVVPATEVSVEKNTLEPLLTLYTCTPLWNPKDRLVIQAKPVGDVR